MRRAAALLFAVAALSATPVAAQGLQPCRLAGIEHEALCGSVRRALDPVAPQGGRQIEIHFAVLPALARVKKPDPVFFFAGGPGQSAISLAPQIAAMLSRFSNGRDIVLVDQRGTGRSAPLECGEDKPGTPLEDGLDPGRIVRRMQECRVRLEALPYGDLRRFTTPLAVQDVDAVRVRLGADRIDLVGVSYGTRVALEYQRQFPQHVRRTVLDGVDPPSLVLPQSAAPDTQAAFDALLAACAADPVCAKRYPDLRARWRGLLAQLPREIELAHPLTGAPQRLVFTREMLQSVVRMPLYSPVLASALPQAIADAADGRFAALAGLVSSFGGGRAGEIAQGLHFSVVCSEDVPRMRADDAGAPDFGDALALEYRRICADWPRASLPPAFYETPPAQSAVLLLSGAIDPATPPRYAQSAARALGALARSVVVPNAGHGQLGLACMREAVYGFVDAASDAEAIAVDTACADALPRPSFFMPIEAGGGG